MCLSHCRYHPYLVGGFSAKSVQIREHTISYLERPSSTGSTSATVVMFHGFTSSKNANVTMAKYFPPDWRVIFPDMPAHGDSSYIPNSDYSVHGIVEMLHEVFNDVFINMMLSCDVVGHCLVLYGTQPQRGTSHWSVYGIICCCTVY